MTSRTLPLKSRSSLLRYTQHAVKRLAHRNYYLAKLYYNFYFQLAHEHSKELLIVFQMGKVGSSTIYSSLRNLELGMPIYHIHVLTQDKIDLVEQLYTSSLSNRPMIPQHLFESQFLRKQLNKGVNTKKWHIVTLVRDPIARNMSAFFQDFETRFPNFNYQAKVKSMKIEALVEELSQLFLTEANHNVPLEWFDDQLKSVFNIDVASSEFPKSKGYQVYHGEAADVLLLRLEDVNKCAPQALKEFLNIDNFVLAQANFAVEKEYYTVYREFLDSIRLPESYLDKMYSAKYVQHFYTEEELAQFRKRWSNPNP